MHQRPPRDSARLDLPAASRFAGFVQAGVERLGLLFGLDKAGAMKLTLAAEELFLYLSDALPEGAGIRLRITDTGFGARAAFSFPAEDIDLTALNITYRPTPAGSEAACDLAAMSLLLASRSVDRLHFKRREGRITLTLDKEKPYERLAPESLPPVEAAPPLAVKDDPSPSEINEACRLIVSRYPRRLIHATVPTPGKLADMAAAGAMRVLTVADGKGRVCGLMLLHETGTSNYRFHGPYVLCDNAREAVIAALAEAAIAGIARTGASGLVSGLAVETLPASLFESLGELAWCDAEGVCRPMPVYYRQLREDDGGVVWAHPDLTPFLRREYDRLDLSREIRPATGAGQTLAARSVFLTRISRDIGEAGLRPLLDGRDRAENLAGHVAALACEGIKNIFLRLDLSLESQAVMAGDLMAAGFVPKNLLPDARRPDEVVFQYGK